MVMGFLAMSCRAQFIAFSTLLMSMPLLTAGNGIWSTTTSPSSWGVAGNWSGNAIADGSNSTADFSTLDITADTTVTLDGNRTIGNLTFGDTNTATAKSWTLSAGTGGTLTLAGTAPTVTVQALGSGKIVNLSAPLAGTSGFTKSGSGTLQLSGGTGNTLTGSISILAGMLRSSDGASFQNMTGAITVASGAALYYGQNFSANNLTNALTLSGAGYGGYGALHLDFNATASGAITLAADATISHDWNNATLSNTITGSDKNLILDNRVKGQGALTINGNISLGSGTLTKVGVNSVTLNGSNSYGAMLISNGMVYFQNAASMGGSGANITIENNGVAARNGTDLNNLLLRVSSSSTGAIAFGGSATSTSTAIDLSGHPSLSLGAKADFIYSGTLTPGGGNYRLGGGGAVLTVSSTLTGANGLIINDVQGGTVVLTGVREYTGATVIKQGTLRVEGNLNGAVSVASGGVLAPGTGSGTGSLTLDHALSVDGALSMRIDRGASQNADLLSAPALSFNGALTVINIGAALQAGDSFQLFSVPGAITRNSLTLTLPSLGAGLTWDFGGLLATGTISVTNVSNVIGYPDFPELLLTQLTAARDAGYVSATINPGTYVLPTKQSWESSFPLNNWSNFTINADNVLFTVGGQRAFTLSNCSNVKIKGCTVRSRNFTYTQGKVIEKGNNGDGKVYAIWQISAGYPANFTTDGAYLPVGSEVKSGHSLNVVDQTTRRINRQVGDNYGNIMTPIGGNRWKVDFSKTSMPFSVGDWIVARGGNGQSHAVFFDNSTNCTVEALTSQGGGFATFYEIGGGGNRLLDCTIECVPEIPAGGSELPLVSCGADGVHCRDAYPGMYVSNLTTTGVLLDDCVAIHGFFHDVTAVAGNAITVSSLGKLKVGDAVRASHDGGYFAQANCTSITDLGGGNFQLTLDQALPIPVGSKVANPKYDGDGYRILNCHLSGTRSRAIIAKADNGVISGCTFEHNGTAIYTGSDYWWNESGYSWNVIIENNTFTSSGGSLYMHYDGAQGNKNLTVRNNVFPTVTGWDNRAIYLKGCDGITISGNQFGVGQDDEMIKFLDCKNIVFSNNLAQYSPTGKPFIELAGAVTNLQGQANGILYSGRAYALTNSLSGLLLANPASNASGDAVQQYSACNASGRWIFQSDGTGFVKILSAANGLALGVNNAAGAATPLVLENPGNGAGQLWTLKPVGTTTIELVNKLSGLSATVTSSALGEAVNQATGSSSPGQLWNSAFNDSTYSTWRIGSGAGVDPNGDDDGDGLNNLAEYALATDLAPAGPATSGGITPLVVNAQTDDYLTLSCRRRVAATDVGFTVLYSNDLINWQATAVRVSAIANPDGTTSEVWRAPVADVPKGFLRVRVNAVN